MYCDRSLIDESTDYYFVNRKRDKLRRFALTENELDYCKSFFYNRCAYCGSTMGDYDGRKKIMTKDHFNRHKLGTLSNCIPSCLHCNCSKARKSFWLWYSLNKPEFSVKRLVRIILWVTYYSKPSVFAKHSIQNIERKINGTSV